MAHIVVVSILLGIWLLIGFPRRERASGQSKRTSKLTIILRIAVIPFAVVSFWGLMFCIADPETGFYFVLGGMGAILGAIGFLWGFTNICTFLYSPIYYRIWKKGGGDPFFDSLDPLLNNGPPTTCCKTPARPPLRPMQPRRSATGSQYTSRSLASANCSCPRLV
jgi:hypothetical protein